MKFDTNTGYFRAKFTYDAAAKDSDTVLYLNREYYYVNGYELTIQKKGDAVKKINTESGRGDNYFRLNVADEVGAQDGDEITIKVFNKKIAAVEVAQ